MPIRLRFRKKSPLPCATCPCRAARHPSPDATAGVVSQNHVTSRGSAGEFERDGASGRYVSHESRRDAIAACQTKETRMAKTVLIVEDNELNMKLFHDLLEAHGYDAGHPQRYRGAGSRPQASPGLDPHGHSAAASFRAPRDEIA